MPDAFAKDLVARYLAGQLTAGELRRRLPDGWELDEAADPELGKTTLLVMGHLAEFDAGEIPEAQLRERLAPYAAWTLKTHYAAADNTAVRVTGPRTEQAAGVGRPPVVELV